LWSGEDRSGTDQARFGSGAGQPTATEGLNADDRANHVTIDIDIPNASTRRDALGDRIDSRMRGVQQTHTYFVMEEVKSTYRLVIPSTAGLV
jgi:hypothetical protein